METEPARAGLFGWLRLRAITYKLTFLANKFFQQVMKIIISLVKYSNFYTNLKKIGTLFKKLNNFTLVFKLHFLLILQIPP